MRGTERVFVKGDRKELERDRKKNKERERAGKAEVSETKNHRTKQGNTEIYETGDN